VATELIVIAVTLLMAGFILIWWCRPALRTWMEAPKYRILTWEKSYPGAVRSLPGEHSEN
jgi:hypothetical protein